MASVTIELLGGDGFDPIEVQVTDLNTLRATSQKTTTPGGGKAKRKLIFPLNGHPAIEVRVRVPRPIWARGAPKPGANGGFISTETEEIVEILDPVKTGYRARAGSMHPRLWFKGTSTKPTPDNVASCIVVDLTFLRVTAYLRDDDRLLPPQNRAAGNTALEALAHDVDPEQNVLSRYRPSEAIVDIYENTRTKKPRLWAVTRPKSLSAANLFHFVLFLMPKGPTYVDGSDIDFVALKRYLLSPPKSAPFFVRVPLNDPRYTSSTPPPPAQRAQLIANIDWPSWVTDCGFAEQVALAKKNVVLATPIAHGSGGGCYGDLETTSDHKTTTTVSADRLTLAGGLQAWLEPLKRALHSEEVAAGGGHPPMHAWSKVRVALGGFSAGAGTAYAVLANNTRTVHELYWFDPITPTSGQEQFLKAWMKGDPTRMVRLIGGVRHVSLLQLEESLRSVAANPSHVSALPIANFWEKSNVYRCAVSMPQHVPWWRAESFDSASVSAATPGGLSEAIGVFEAVKPPPGPVVSGHRDIGYRLQGRAPGGRQSPAPENTVDGGTMVDLLGLARFSWLQQRLAPHPHLYSLAGQTTPTIDGFIAFVKAALGFYRHQWAAVGGDGDDISGPGDPTRRNGFVGHLHACILRGDFK